MTATHWSMSRVLPRREILARLEQHYGPIAPVIEESSAPADRYRLPDGTTFDGVGGLRSALLKHSDEFIGTLTEKLLTYALGRGVEYYDAPAIRRIGREAAKHDYRFSSIVLGIVNSQPFLMRKSADAAEPPSAVTAAKVAR